jgi:hypothetical protein
MSPSQSTPLDLYFLSRGKFMVGLFPKRQRRESCQPRATPWVSRRKQVSPEGAVHRRAVGPGLQPSMGFDGGPRALPWAGLRPGPWPSRSARPPANPRRWICISCRGGSSWLASFPSANGANHASPGQRPGYQRASKWALKGRSSGARLGRAFSPQWVSTKDPGRCPGLV